MFWKTFQKSLMRFTTEHFSKANAIFCDSNISTRSFVSIGGFVQKVQMHFQKFVWFEIEFNQFEKLLFLKNQKQRIIYYCQLKKALPFHYFWRRVKEHPRIHWNRITESAEANGASHDFTSWVHYLKLRTTVCLCFFWS